MFKDVMTNNFLKAIFQERVWKQIQIVRDIWMMQWINIESYGVGVRAASVAQNKFGFY
jgi:hypothetical protein